MSFGECYDLAEKNYLKGKHVESIRWYEKSLALIPNDKQNLLPIIYTNLGHAYDYTGQVEEARVNYKNALRIAIKTGNKFGEVTSLIGLSLCEYRLNEDTKAISILVEAEKISQKIHFKKGLAYVYLQLGVIYDDQKSRPIAEKYILKSLEIMNSGLGDYGYGDIALANKTLAAIYFSSYQYQNCREYLQIAEHYDKLSNNNYSHALTLENLGLVYLVQKDYTGALTYLKAALNLFLELGNKKEAAWVYYNLGTAYRLLKDPNTKETLDNALKEAMEIGDLELTGLIHLQLGLFYRETNPEVAYDNLKSAIRFHEKIRENVIYYEHHAGLNSRLGYDSFKSLIELCVDLDRKEEAFQILEQSKSIAFVSLMRYSKLVPKVNSNEFKSLVEKEEAYLRQLKIIQTSANTSDYSNTSEASKLVSEISDVYDKMQVIDPEYVNMRRGKITTFRELKEISKQSNIIFVEYFLASDTRIFIFIITESSFDLKIVNLPYSIIDYFVAFVKRVIDSSKYPNQVSKVRWTELSDYLIAPVNDFIQNDKIICFVPSGVLFYIPLHSLQQNDEPIIKKHPIFYCASSSLFCYYRLRQHRTPINCGAYALNDKRYLFEAEANDIAKMFNSEPMLDISKEKLIRHIENKDILHFATHGKFVGENPLHSHIKLNENENLEAIEIFNLDISSSLVTLSACDTGVSEIKSGDELIGLTHSLLYAGAASVVVSLWKAEDAVTRDLMTSFYQLLKANKIKVVALQQAQIQMISEGKSVREWAPFVMMGNFQ